MKITVDNKKQVCVDGEKIGNIRDADEGGIVLIDLDGYCHGRFDDIEEMKEYIKEVL